MYSLIIIFLLAIIFVPLSFAESSNVGIIYWKQEIVSKNSFVDIYVEDDDMNKKEYPNFADKFTIHVWSDTSPNGLDIQVVETGVYSGIFKGSVFVADSGETLNNRLVSNPGDILYAKYIDNTLPTGKTSEIISTAVVKISGQNMDEILNKIDPSLRSKKTTELVPSWVKNNAGWWADGIVGDNEFVQSIQFLIKEKILVIPLVETKTSTSQEIPSWVKNNAGWWAKGEISEADFLNGIKHLIQTGLISTDSEAKSDGKNDIFQECESIKSAYTRLGCEKEIKQKIEFEDFKNKSTGYTVGSTIFYYPEIGNFGNELEISTGGQALLRLRIMVENTGTDNITLMCTGPSICNYDVWDGSKAFKYAGMDFVSGQIVIKPKTSFIFNIMFGPNIGYGGTTFEFDETKEYYFRINESWGKTTIPLNLSK